MDHVQKSEDNFRSYLLPPRWSRCFSSHVFFQLASPCVSGNAAISHLEVRLQGLQMCATISGVMKPFTFLFVCIAVTSCTCGGRMTACGNYLSPSNTPGDEFRSSSLAVSILLFTEPLPGHIWLFYVRFGSWTQVCEFSRQVLLLTGPCCQPKSIVDSSLRRIWVCANAGTWLEVLLHHRGYDTQTRESLIVFFFLTQNSWFWL